MMERYFSLGILAGGCLAALVSGAEQRIEKGQLPAAVRETVRQQSEGAILRGLSKEVENGKTFYEAELTVNGHNKDVLIDPAGTVVEVEEQAPLASLPAPLKAACEKRAAKGKIESVESVTKGGKIVAYEAKIRAAGKVTELRLSPSGAPME